MPVGRVLNEIFFITDEMHVPIALITMATIWGIGGRQSAPELRAGVAQQAADISFLIPTHRDTSSLCTSMWPWAVVTAFDDFEIAPAKRPLRVQALPKHGVGAAT
jgi:hypothetical protein